ncbi:unnamed protein product [Orchesella dallaii]|uniref:Uncharacterized protein n=1 Tax=Orchesella dallaii TaxID=48710 RepID=A0ABP1R821_9HEXA
MKTVRKSFFSRDKLEGTKRREFTRVDASRPQGLGVDNVLKLRKSNEKSQSAASSKTPGEPSWQMSRSNLSLNSFTFGSLDATLVEPALSAKSNIEINSLDQPERSTNSNKLKATFQSTSHPRRQPKSNTPYYIADICQSYQDDALFSFNQGVADMSHQPTTTNNLIIQVEPKRLFSVSDSFRKSVPGVNPKSACEGRSSLPNPSRPHQNQTITTATRQLKISEPQSRKGKHIKSFKRTPIQTTASSTPSVDDFGLPEVDEVSKLESSIVVEDSPVKVKVIKSRRLKRLQLKHKSLTRISASDEASQDNSRLNSQISEYSSAQSSESPIAKTPLAVWIRKDQSDVNGDVDEIVQIDSPTKRKRQQDVHNKAEKFGTSSKSLLESFKSIKAHYDSSVRLFAHDLRKNKYDEDTVLPLLIRSIERQDKLMKATAYNFKDEKHLYILFKPLDVYEIKEGVFLKLYQPWQEVHIPGTSCSMIIAADFYKIVHKNEFNLTSGQIKTINELPIPYPGVIGVSEPLLMDLVPYNLKNQRTIMNEIRHYKSFIDIEVVVLNLWKEMSPVMALLKDSDGFVSILEIPKNEDDFISILSPGRYISLARIAVGRMINIAEKLDLFSLLTLFGAEQIYYYVLRLVDESEWKMETLLNITMVQKWEQLLGIEEIYSVPTQEDQRISLECKLKEIEKDYILVTDESDMSLKVEFVFKSENAVPNLTSNIEVGLKLKFLRLIHGKVIWDKFTTFIKMVDADEDQDNEFIEMDESF